MPFNSGTRDVMDALGAKDPKTLHRRRVGYQDKDVSPRNQFLQEGIHFRRKSPNSSALVWDLSKTLKAWDEATLAMRGTAQ